MRASWLEINLSALTDNLAVIRQVVGPSVTVCCVLKANAYGLGASEIARHLVQSKAEMFAVYSLDEATELAENGIESPMLILMPVRHWSPYPELNRLAKLGLVHLTVHDSKQVVQIDAIGRQLGCQIPIHFYLDTGMSRSGLTAAELSMALEQAEQLANVRCAGIYTHLATADSDPSIARDQLEQIERFVSRSKCASMLPVHVANTFALWRGRPYHHSMVRVGLGLFGYGPEQLKGDPIVPRGTALRPIVRWRSHIVHVQPYPAGCSVGYGCTHRLERDSLLGIVPVGFGHGYPLALSNCGVVRVICDTTQAEVPVVGRVSMDQIVIDLTEPVQVFEDGRFTKGSWPQRGRPRVGNLVELISDTVESPCALHKVAQLANSSCHELLCRLSPRLPRRWVVEPEVVPKLHTSVSNQQAQVTR